MKKGYLITFEGGEGSGKTTQIGKLSEYLNELQVDHICLREPGGTQIGDQIRNVLQDMKNMGMCSETELLLYQASRAQIVRERLLPYLDEGKVVILDRFFDSTLAYQGGGRGLGGRRIWDLIRFATSGLMPDLTLLMDISVEEGLRRRAESEEWNRMDAQSPEFYEDVRKAYWTFLNFDDEGRWEMVNAGRGVDEVFCDVKRIVEGRLFERGFLEKMGSCKERK